MHVSNGINSTSIALLITDYLLLIMIDLSPRLNKNWYFCTVAMFFLLATNTLLSKLTTTSPNPQIESTIYGTTDEIVRCQNGPYVLDLEQHLEGIGSTFLYRKRSLVLAQEIGAKWIGYLSNRHDLEKKDNTWENYYDSFFGLGDKTCSLNEILSEYTNQRRKKMNFHHMMYDNPQLSLNNLCSIPKSRIKEKFWNRYNLTKSSVFVFLGESWEYEFLPPKFKREYRKKFMRGNDLFRNYCLFNSEFRARYEIAQKKRLGLKKHHNETWVTVHFRWGDVATNDVEQPDKRAGVGLSVYKNIANNELKKLPGHNKRVLFLSEGNKTLFESFLKRVPNSEYITNSGWTYGIDLLAQSDVIIGGTSSYFVLGAHLCKKCKVIQVANDARKFAAPSEKEKRAKKEHHIYIKH